MRYSLLASCLVWALICLVISGISGWVSASHISGWYQTLAQPTFSPPKWLFAPVWTILYIAIGIAGGLLWQERKHHPVFFVLFMWQLMFNFSWSFIFFVGENIRWALVDILALWLSILFIVALSFMQKNRIGWLLLPYLLWVSFAAVLNYCIWRLN
jgi:tryptophan-rich sensory protein